MRIGDALTVVRLNGVDNVYSTIVSKLKSLVISRVPSGLKSKSIGLLPEALSVTLCSGVVTTLVGTPAPDTLSLYFRNVFELFCPMNQYVFPFVESILQKLPIRAVDPDIANEPVSVPSDTSVPAAG